MDYSVIIRTKNSGKTIEACLESLLHQTIKPSEIVVVDSGSTDETMSIIKKYNITLLHYPINVSFNYSRALNLGIEKTVTPYILILSSHVCFLNEKSVFLMFESLNKESKCIAVSMDRTDSKVQTKISCIDEIEKEIIDNESFKGKAMFNFCSFIHKSSWEKYPFNINIPTCEDQDWSYNFIKEEYYAEIILNSRVYYNNPYYNAKKDALETFTIGKWVYPYYISYQYMKEMFKTGIKEIIEGKADAAKFSFLVSWYIFRFKYLGLYNTKSVYNKRLQ